MNIIIVFFKKNAHKYDCREQPYLCAYVLKIIMCLICHQTNQQPRLKPKQLLRSSHIAAKLKPHIIFTSFDGDFPRTVYCFGNNVIITRFFSDFKL